MDRPQCHGNKKNPTNILGVVSDYDLKLLNSRGVVRRLRRGVYFFVNPYFHDIGRVPSGRAVRSYVAMLLLLH